MSDATPPRQQLVTELKVSAHLMQLDAGVYCIYHSPGSASPDAATGLPGARVSLPPGQSGQDVTITGFREDGWLGSLDSAALIRVGTGPAQVLMTIYQARDSAHEPPRLQVMRLTDAAAATAPAAAAPSAPAEPEISAHLQQDGDVRGRLGEWVGERGSQRWVEGFGIDPQHPSVTRDQIEYQAVLGRGWLSPWAEGGQFCGSRGMALPILGLRARLRGKAAETHGLDIRATFTDGTQIGPVGPGDACEAESLAPLEAFCITVVPIGDAMPAAPAGAPAAKRRPSPGKPTPAATEPSAKPSRGARR